MINNRTEPRQHLIPARRPAAGRTRVREGGRDTNPAPPPPREPSFLIGEFPEGNLAQLQPQPRHDSPRQLRVGIPAEHLYVGHGRRPPSLTHSTENASWL